MRSITVSFILAAASVTACAAQATDTEAPDVGTRALAELRGRGGEALGTVLLEQTPHGVLLTLDLDGLPEGAHAFHLHAVGTCQGDFTSAGDHFAPLHNAHGYRSPEGYHAGDLPNVFVPATGRLEQQMFTPRVRLDPSETGLFDADGTAVVLHANADDYASQPAGDAGERIACGAIRKLPM